MDEQQLLSQEEIDALLSAVAPEPGPRVTAQAAPEPVDHVRLYDFRQPDRFSKEQMRALRMIHETWARRISLSLTAHLRTQVEVNLADIDQGVYASLVQQIPDLGVYYIVSMPPLPGHLMLYLNLELAMVILDRMMGGPGKVFRSSRAMTDLEFGLLRSVGEKLAFEFEGSWGNTAGVQARVDDVLSSLMLVPLGLPTDAILWLSFEVRINGVARAMVLGLPYVTLKPVASRLSPYVWFSNAEPNQQDGNKLNKQRVETTVGKAKAVVSAVLGSTVLTLEELASLQQGDVLPLSSRADGLCNIMVNGHLKFRGRAGTRQRRLAVQVDEIVEEDWQQKELEPATAAQESL